jgi:hypothetical protein
MLQGDVSQLLAIQYHLSKLGPTSEEYEAIDCKRGCVKRSEVEVGIRRIVDCTSYCLRNSFKERGSLSI